MSRPAVAVVLLAGLLSAGCRGPLLVPEAGPNAPGYRTRSAPPAPGVTVRSGPLPAGGAAAGGSLDSVQVEGSDLVVTGWARLDDQEPRGSLRIAVSTPVGRVTEVEPLPRPDVVAATGSAALTYAGFAVHIRAAGPGPAPQVCVLSVSAQGTFRLNGSATALCP